MGKKKQDKKAAAPVQKKSILDSLKFMQLSNTVLDRKHKHKKREEWKSEDVNLGEKKIAEESMPFFFKKVQEIAKKNTECIENKVE
jgi:hypothetical protein